MSKLSADAVEKLVKECLFRDGEDTSDPALAEGITRKFGFNRTRLSERTGEIKEMLAELPDEFQASKGGGWTFMNACVDRDGRQWGEHRDMENLFCLGIAAGVAQWQMPREMWNILPGGMPYVAVNI